MKQQQDEEASGSLAREGQEEKGSRGPCMCQMSRELKLVESVEVVPASQPKGSIRAVCVLTPSAMRDYVWLCADPYSRSVTVSRNTATPGCCCQAHPLSAQALHLHMHYASSMPRRSA